MMTGPPFTGNTTELLRSVFKGRDNIVSTMKGRLLII
jgi:hypothetical protein